MLAFVKLLIYLQGVEGEKLWVQMMGVVSLNNTKRTDSR